MPAQRRIFHDPLESIVYWDSSFAIAHFDDRHDYHAQCADFRHRLEGESVLSVSSDLVHNELAFHTIRSALVVEARRIGQHWRDKLVRTMKRGLEAERAQVQAEKVVKRYKKKAAGFHFGLAPDADYAQELMEAYRETFPCPPVED